MHKIIQEKFKDMVNNRIKKSKTMTTSLPNEILSSIVGYAMSSNTPVHRLELFQLIQVPTKAVDNTTSGDPDAISALDPKI